MSKVSVITPVYNGEKYLEKTVFSILAQDYELELIIIDDGSTDKSSQILKSIQDGRIKYNYQKNTGKPVGPKNKGIGLAAGDFIAFCDQDDIWYKEKLKKQIAEYEAIEDRGNIGIIVCSTDLIDEKGKKIGQNKLTGEVLEQGKAFERLVCGNFISACSTIVPKKVIEEVGLMDESLNGVDDYDLWLRICRKYGILIVAEPLCAWRKTREALSADKSRLYEENEKIFEKLEALDKTDIVKIGHGKNIMRIIVSSILSDKDKKANQYIAKTSLYPVSVKGEYIIKLYRKNKQICKVALQFLRLVGRVSL